MEMKYSACVLLACAAAAARAAPAEAPQQQPALRQALQQSHPATTPPPPRELSPQERAELRRQLGQDAPRPRR